MALISCPDCGAKVSDQAPACVKCGRPIAARNLSVGKEAPIELTAKRLKLNSVCFLSIFFIGAFFCLLTSFSGPAGEGSLLGPGIMAIGLFFYLINGVRIWWHHK